LISNKASRPKRKCAESEHFTGRPSAQCRNAAMSEPRRVLPLFSFDITAPIEDKPRMPKKPGTNPKGEFAFFNVLYEDGSVRSNRRVPNEILGGLEGDEPARGYIMEQDREIAEKSGRPQLAIKSISRVGAKKK
jgi:hypothetical protein